MPKSTAERVQEHRDRLRESGLKPVQIWVPDTRRPGFAKECRRQSRLIASDSHDEEMVAWLESVADTEGWEP
jgi:hypothetical protein